MYTISNTVTSYAAYRHSIIYYHLITNNTAIVWMTSYLHILHDIFHLRSASSSSSTTKSPKSTFRTSAKLWAHYILSTVLNQAVLGSKWLFVVGLFSGMLIWKQIVQTFNRPLPKCYRRSFIEPGTFCTIFSRKRLTRGTLLRHLRVKITALLVVLVLFFIIVVITSFARRRSSSQYYAGGTTNCDNKYNK
jgi:hypothetical protein